MIGKIIDNYIISELIGEGGMAKVYKGWDDNLGRDVAIKMIQPEFVEKDTFLKRFEQEAKVTAGLDEINNIVFVFDYGLDGDIPYLVMEYIPGGTLKDLLTKLYHWEDAVRILLPVTRALEQAHKKGVIHRDIKPANLLVKDPEHLMLSDFGIAKMLIPSEENYKFTMTGSRIGTPQYMAPEQKKGGKVDKRVDVYSLGVVLYEMVTGWAPDLIETPTSVIWKYIDEVNVPDEFIQVLIRVLKEDPDERYQTMGEFALALENLLQRANEAAQSDKLLENLAGSAGYPSSIETLMDEPEISITKSKRRLWFIGCLGSLLTVMSAACVFLFIWGVPRLSSSFLATQNGEPLLSANPTFTMEILPTQTEANLFPSATIDDSENGLLVEPLTDTPQPPTETPIPSSSPTPSPEPTITLTATPVGGGGLIAFHSNRSGNNDIYVMNSAGGDLRQLTHETADDRAPSWSPDGVSIAYKSNLDGDYEIYIIDLRSGNRWQVTENDCNDHSPVWSPDGRQFVFYSDCDGNREIYIIDADGRNREQLTKTSGIYNWFAVWSPDGKQIAFSSNRNGKYQVHLMDTDGSNSRALTDGCVPFYSPDGEKIVFNQYCRGGGNIWVMNGNGSNAKAITEAPKDWNSNPSWSADGQKIIFQVEENEISDLWMMDPDGSNWVQLTDNSASDVAPVWQPMP